MNWEAIATLLTLACAIIGSAVVLVFRAGAWWRGVDKNISRLADKMGEIGDELKQMRVANERRMGTLEDRVENIEVRVTVLEDHDRE